jgi:arabinose-5-phosphate isomerase
MPDAVTEMTAKGFGCVGIVDREGRLVGIITDGDLRRYVLRANLLEARVEDVMTRSPRTVRADQLASETVALINAAKITAMFVVDGGKPIGLVHLHDLLRAGVA